MFVEYKSEINKKKILLVVIILLVGSSLYYFGIQNNSFNQLAKTNDKNTELTVSSLEVKKIDRETLKIYIPKKYSFSILGETNNWKKFNGNGYSYKYPQALIQINNPRNLHSSPELQYYFLNQTIASDYLDCIDKGREQSRQYKQNLIMPEQWVDWERECDINRVVFTININQIDSLSINDFYKHTIIDSHKREWDIYLSPGMGDQVGLIAVYIDRVPFVLNIKSHERVLHKFLQVKKSLESEKNNPEYEDYLEDIMQQIISTVEFIN